MSARGRIATPEFSLGDALLKIKNQKPEESLYVDEEAFYLTLKIDQDIFLILKRPREVGDKNIWQSAEDFTEKFGIQNLESYHLWEKPTVIGTIAYGAYLSLDSLHSVILLPEQQSYNFTQHLQYELKNTLFIILIGFLFLMYVAVSYNRIVRKTHPHYEKDFNSIREELLQTQSLAIEEQKERVQNQRITACLEQLHQALLELNIRFHQQSIEIREMGKILIQNLTDPEKSFLSLAEQLRLLVDIHQNADYESSIKFMKKGYSLLESIDGYADEKLRSLTNLAQFEILKGNVDSASHYIQAGSQFLKDSKSDIYKTLFHFAKALIAIDQGKLEEAYQETLLEEDLFKNIKDYPTLRFAQQIQKSEILIKMNQHKQASEVARAVLEASKKFFQTEDHTITARSKVMLGLALANEGTFEKGLRLIDEAIATYNKTYKGDKKHANQAFSHKTRGDILALKGDVVGAFKEYEEAHKIYKIVYTNDTIDDISALYLSFVQAGLKLKDDFIVKKHFQKHLIAFGVDHPRTKLIIKEIDQQK